MNHTSLLSPIAEAEAEARFKILEKIDSFFEQFRAPKEFIPGKSCVPVSGKVFDSLDMKLAIEASLDFWLTTGRFNERFEESLSQFTGIQYVSTVNSGSSANLVAFSTLTSPFLKKRALQTGDEVIAVAACFPTTVTTILQHGLVPVFVDIDIPTYNINVQQIEEAISKKTRAIFLAHTLGNPFDLDAILKLAHKYDLWVIEDCCDALGSTYQGKSVGSFGDLATLSFYPAHHITTGEGGAVMTKQGQLKKIAESFRDWGRDCYCPPGKDNTCGKRFCWQLGDLPLGYDHKYVYSHMGYNLKITDWQAAIGLGQIQKLPHFISKRKENFSFYKKHFQKMGSFFILPEATPNSDPSWFGFPITIRKDAPFTRKMLIDFLNQHQIATRFLFSGNIIYQPFFKGRDYRKIGPLLNTDEVMNNTFWIGVYPGISSVMRDYVIEIFEKFLKLFEGKSI